MIQPELKILNVMISGVPVDLLNMANPIASAIYQMYGAYLATKAAGDTPPDKTV